MRGSMTEGKFSRLETNCEKDNIIDLYRYRKEL
jgi:hypothetical protein